jgi:hypothetical protein
MRHEKRGGILRVRAGPRKGTLKRPARIVARWHFAHPRRCFLVAHRKDMEALTTNTTIKACFGLALAVLVAVAVFVVAGAVLDAAVGS